MKGTKSLSHYLWVYTGRCYTLQVTVPTEEVNCQKEEFYYEETRVLGLNTKKKPNLLRVSGVKINIVFLRGVGVGYADQKLNFYIISLNQFFFFGL